MGTAFDGDSTKRHDAARQVLMKAQLERIRDTEGMSKDVFEIATKSIEG